jgi:hypothetical protein
VIDIAKRSEILPPLPMAALAASVSIGGAALAITLESPQSPRDVYVFDLEANAVVRYTGAKPVRSIPCSSCRPSCCATRAGTRSTDAAGRFPRSSTPEAARRVRIPSSSTSMADRIAGDSRFNAFTQFLVREMGFVVITPNVRGSSGYGKRIWISTMARSRRRGSGHRRPAGVDRRAAGSRRQTVFVSGGSYGGYMSLASMVNFGDRLRGGIDVVGISNFVTFLESTVGLSPQPAPPGIR